MPVAAVPAEEPMENLGTVTTMPDFADDSVMVVLTHEASLEFIDYTPTDFPEIECAEIEDLSSGKGAKVQVVLRGEELETDSIGARFMNQNIDVDGFRRILYLKLTNPSKGNVLRAVAALEQREDVYFAEPNYIYQLDIPTEAQSAVAQNVPVFGWGAEKIEQEAAWEIETGSNTIYVGVLDSGIDNTHPELDNKVRRTLSADFVGDGFSATDDPLGHGTHVAGIIAAKYDDDVINFSGVCQYVRLVSLRVISSYNTALGSDIADAINYSEINDIPLLNLSLQLTNNSGYGTVYSAVVNYTGLIIQAAGNSGMNYEDADAAPAYWELENVVVVGASTSSDTRWVGVNDASNYGNSVVDLFAPGHNIVSCYPSSMCPSTGCSSASHAINGYHFFSGTSIAAPFVTGVAALISASHPDATPATIKDTIVYSVDPIAALSNMCISGGRLNAYNALTSKILHSDVTYTSIDWTYHQVSCDDCDATWQEAHLERPGVEYCIYCQEFLG